MAFSKTTKNVIIIFTFLAFAISFLLYVNRINIFEPIKIKIKQEQNYITKGITIKAIGPLYGSQFLETDTSNFCWTINEGYYNKIQLIFDSSIFNKKEKNIIVEIYSPKESALIVSFQKTITKNNSLEINYFRDRDNVLIINKILFLNYYFFVFLLSCVFSVLIVFLVKNASILKKLNFIIPIIIVLWGFFWIILASFYTFPNAEDLYFILKSDNFEIFRGAYQILYNPGRYFANFMHGFHPLSWGFLSYYKYIPILSLMLVTFSLYFFIISIFRKRIKKLFAFLIASFIIVFHFSSTPSIVYDLFWMAPCFEYLYSYVFFFLWTGFFIRLLQSKKDSNKLIFLIISSVLLFCCCGTNEMMMLLNSFSLLVFTFIVFKFFKGNKHNIISLILIFVGCAFLIFSNGTIERFNSFDSERNFHFFKQVLICGNSQFFSTIYKWSFANTMTIPLIIGFTILVKSVEKTLLDNITKRQIIFLTLGLFLTMYSIPYIYYFSMGIEDYPSRVYNVDHWIYLMIIFGCIPILLSKTKIFSKRYIEKYKTQILSVILIFSLFQIVFSENNLYMIRKEYCGGVFREYKKEMINRYEQINSARKIRGWKCAEIDSLTIKPKTIFIEPDIFTNRKLSKWNKSYEGYFMVDEIKIKGDTISKLKIIKKNVQE